MSFLLRRPGCRGRIVSNCKKRVIGVCDETLDIADVRSQQCGNRRVLGVADVEPNDLWRTSAQHANSDEILITCREREVSDTCGLPHYAVGCSRSCQIANMR